MWCDVMLYYAMVCYVILLYVTLRYSILWSGISYSSMPHYLWEWVVLISMPINVPVPIHTPRWFYKGFKIRALYHVWLKFVDYGWVETISKYENFHGLESCGSYWVPANPGNVMVHHPAPRVSTWLGPTKESMAFWSLIWWREWK